MRPIRPVTAATWVVFLAVGYAGEAARADTKTFTTNATIDCSDVSWEGWDIIVRGCTVTINGTHFFNSLTVERDPNNPTTKAGKVTHDVFATCVYGSDMVYGLDLTIETNVMVQGASGSWLGSSIDLTGKGYIHGAGAGQGQDASGGAGGAGYGGAGGNGLGGNAGGTYGTPTVPLSCREPLDFGSGGGDSAPPGAVGGAGGGIMRLIVGGALTVNGTISANGAGSPNGFSGGGSGGSAWITAGTIMGIGLFTANGGSGGYDWGNAKGGGGGGGRIAVYAGNLLIDDGQINAFGGPGVVGGGAGTVYIESPVGSHGRLIVSNGAACGATTEFSDEQVFDMDLYVTGCGIVGPPSGHANLHLIFNGDVEVASGGYISADARGFSHSDGPGQGQNAAAGAGGGGHGGAGGDGIGGNGGGTYDSVPSPTEFGSGGGDKAPPSEVGGAGGGVLRMTVNGVLTVHGRLSANGANSPNGFSGGGAGGSLWITADTIGGLGLITANGGNGGYDWGDPKGGGGGGGRVAVYTCDLQIDPGYITTNGGSGWHAGVAGTVFHGSPQVEITQQPYDAFAFTGEAVVFWVGVSGGSGTLHYQWRHSQSGQTHDLDPNDPRFDGVNDWLLVIRSVVVGDAGQYDVLITDDCGQAISEPAVLIVPPPGDLTCDGTLDFADINPFVSALTNPAAYAHEFPYCDIMLADINGDGSVDFGDINPFVALLTGNP